MPRLHLIRSPDTSGVPCRRLHVSRIGENIVVTTTCIHLNLRVEHCFELISVYMYLYPSTCRRIQVARPGHLYPATCIGCKRGLRCSFC